MNNKVTAIIFWTLVFLIQLAISDYLNLGTRVYLCLIPLIIINVPFSKGPQVTMLMAFGIGIALDILSDGIIGLNAASAVLAAALRKPIYRSFVNADRQDKTEVPTIYGSGILKYIEFLASVTAVYLLTYILLDCAGFRPIGFIALKFIVSLVVDVAVALLISASFLNRK